MHEHRRYASERLGTSMTGRVTPLYPTYGANQTLALYTTRESHGTYGQAGLSHEAVLAAAQKAAHAAAEAAAAAAQAAAAAAAAAAGSYHYQGSPYNPSTYAIVQHNPHAEYSRARNQLVQEDYRWSPQPSDQLLRHAPAGAAVWARYDALYAPYAVHQRARVRSPVPAPVSNHGGNYSAASYMTGTTSQWSQEEHSEYLNKMEARFVEGLLCSRLQPEGHSQGPSKPPGDDLDVASVDSRCSSPGVHRVPVMKGLVKSDTSRDSVAVPQRSEGRPRPKRAPAGSEQSREGPPKSKRAKTESDGAFARAQAELDGGFAKAKTEFDGGLMTAKAESVENPKREFGEGRSAKRVKTECEVESRPIHTPPLASVKEDDCEGAAGGREKLGLSTSSARMKEEPQTGRKLEQREMQQNAAVEMERHPQVHKELSEMQEAPKDNQREMRQNTAAEEDRQPQKVSETIDFFARQQGGGQKSLLEAEHALVEEARAELAANEPAAGRTRQFLEGFPGFVEASREEWTAGKGQAGARAFMSGGAVRQESAPQEDVHARRQVVVPLGLKSALPKPHGGEGKVGAKKGSARPVFDLNKLAEEQIKSGSRGQSWGKDGARSRPQIVNSNEAMKTPDGALLQVGTAPEGGAVVEAAAKSGKGVVANRVLMFEKASEVPLDPEKRRPKQRQKSPPHREEAAPGVREDCVRERTGKEGTGVKQDAKPLEERAPSEGGGPEALLKGCSASPVAEGRGSVQPADRSATPGEISQRDVATAAGLWYQRWQSSKPAQGLGEGLRQGLGKGVEGSSREGLRGGSGGDSQKGLTAGGAMQGVSRVYRPVAHTLFRDGSTEKAWTAQVDWITADSDARNGGVRVSSLAPTAGVEELPVPADAGDSGADGAPAAAEGPKEAASAEKGRAGSGSVAERGVFGWGREPQNPPPLEKKREKEHLEVEKEDVSTVEEPLAGPIRQGGLSGGLGSARGASPLAEGARASASGAASASGSASATAPSRHSLEQINAWKARWQPVIGGSGEGQGDPGPKPLSGKGGRAAEQAIAQARAALMVAAKDSSAGLEQYRRLNQLLSQCGQGGGSGPIRPPREIVERPPRAQSQPLNLRGEPKEQTLHSDQGIVPGHSPARAPRARTPSPMSAPAQRPRSANVPAAISSAARLRGPSFEPRLGSGESGAGRLVNSNRAVGQSGEFGAGRPVDSNRAVGELGESGLGHSNRQVGASPEAGVEPQLGFRLGSEPVRSSQGPSAGSKGSQEATNQGAGDSGLREFIWTNEQDRLKRAGSKVWKWDLGVKRRRAGGGDGDL